jgi:hypothetical protein
MDAERRLVENAFLVLGLAADAPRLDVEREAQKLLGMLELGLAAAATYPTPLGPRPRTPELVRAAAATLRDPERRLVAEIWARGMLPLDAAPATTTGAAAVTGTATVTVTATDAEAVTATGVWAGALARLGWSPR